MLRSPCAAALLLSTCSLSAAIAAEPEKIVVTADRLERPARETASDVTVIDEAQIKQRGAVFLVDILRGQPGVTVTQTGGSGGQTAVRLRGEEGYRTLVLVDGMKVADPSGTQALTYFTNMPVSGIERIEILRGPQSLLYGGDAIGGVISIITKRGQDGVQYGGGAMGGSFGTLAGDAYVRGRKGVFDWSVIGERFHTEGFSAQTGPGFSEDDGFDNSLVHAVLGISLSEATRVQAVARYVDSEAQFDRFGDNDNVLYTEQFTSQFSAKTDWGTDTTEAKIEYFSQNRADYANGAPYPFGARFDAERLHGDFLGNFQLAENLRAIGGAEVEQEKATTDSLDKERTNTGVYGELIGQFDWFFLTGGARFDDSDQFGQHVSWRTTAAILADVFEGADPIKFRASYGTGFRYPSMYELFDSFSGDPTLKEETGEGWDAGVDITFARGELSFTYFDQQIEDEIRFDPNLFFYYQSDARSTSRGAEVSLNYEIVDGLTFAGVYTYTDAKIASHDLENGMARLRRPRHSGSVRLNYSFLEGRANLNAALEYAAKHEDGFYVFRTPLDGHGVVNLAGSYRVFDNVELTLTGINVLDEKYVEAAGFATQGASVYAGVRAAF